HDHKFDAIPQSDYYALAGIFRSTDTFFGNPPSEFGNVRNVQARRGSSLLLLPVNDPNPFDTSYSRQEMDSMRERFRSLGQQLRDLRSNSNSSNNVPASARIRINNQLAEVSAKLAVVDDDGNPRSYCMGVQDKSSAQDSRLYVRGEIDQPGPEVSRGFPGVLCSDQPTLSGGSSGRLELARWIASEDNPLTARVMVNRIWQHMLGSGIVVSTENFGVTGQEPSHPELLDHLAMEFTQSGWSVKTVIRKIANSRVYRMDSSFDQRQFDYDPDNALLWRANPRRLDAEAIRDAMLSLGGGLDLERPRGSEVAKAGYVRVRQGVLGDPRDLARQVVENAASGLRDARRQRSFGGRFSNSRRFGGRGSAGMGASTNLIADSVRKVRDQLDMEDATFRSVYLPIVRDEVPRSMEVFDFADASAITGTRESSNTANQSLYMMNNRFVIKQSQAVAKRVADEYSRPVDQIDYAFKLVYGRAPTSGERSATSEFVKSFAKTLPASARQSGTLSALCQSLFASAEFRYID
ncbi:MAG: DUF1553 domain-containing protein, partial [Planctomycetota bacterium]